MSTFAELVLKPNTTKILLLELDILRVHTEWYNWRAGTWFFNIDGVYSGVDSDLSAGAGSYSIVNVGSVLVDNIPMTSVATAALCQSTDSSFFFDKDNEFVYLHCPGGYEPTLFSIELGIIYGFRKGGETFIFDDLLYEDRIVSAPSIRKQKDDQFFGVSRFAGGSVTLDNADGFFDTFVTDNDFFGNPARLKLGFDDLSYSNYETIFTGKIGSVKLSRESFSVNIEETKKLLSRVLPINTFDTTTYANLNPENEGKPIQLGWGIIKRAEAVCVNENESPAPVSYTFKICDMTDYDSISSIDQVYDNNGVAITPATTDLSAAEFTITVASGDYSPGDTITVDYTGYEDSDGNAIENGLDIAQEILTIFYDITYDTTFFNTSKWENGKARDINVLISEPTQVIDVINNIAANGVQGDFIVEDDGRYAFIVFDQNRGKSQEINKEMELSVPNVNYNVSNALTSTRIGYNRTWFNNGHKYLVDKSQESAIFDIYKNYIERVFNSLTSDSTEAQNYSDTVLFFSNEIRPIISVTTKMQPVQREVGDFVDVEVNRANAVMLNWIRGEIINITKDFNNWTVQLDVRYIKDAPVYTQSTYYNDSYYNDNYYGTTGEVDRGQ